MAPEAHMEPPETHTDAPEAHMAPETRTAPEAHITAPETHIAALEGRIAAPITRTVQEMRSLPCLRPPSPFHHTPGFCCWRLLHDRARGAPVKMLERRTLGAHGVFMTTPDSRTRMFANGSA